MEKQHNKHMQSSNSWTNPVNYLIGNTSTTEMNEEVIETFQQRQARDGANRFYGNSESAIQAKPSGLMRADPEADVPIRKK